MESLDRKQLRPVDYPGLIRLGVPKDGGYVVPEAHVRRSTVLLSLGMKQDWSFEKDFVAAGAGARVIGVDPSVGPQLFARQIVLSLFKILGGGLGGKRRSIRKHVAVLRNSLDYFWFFGVRHRHVRKRVSGTLSATDITLARLLEIANAEGRHGVFLKMDVEGSEYAVIPDIVSCEGRINGIVAEFHDLSRKPAVFNRAIAQLLQHFRIVHIHGNNYSTYDSQLDFPNAVEITFVNTALHADAPTPSPREYPTPGLDFPNLQTRPDYRLRFE
jgi:hypothetical protein